MLRPQEFSKLLTKVAGCSQGQMDSLVREIKSTRLQLGLAQTAGIRLGSIITFRGRGRYASLIKARVTKISHRNILAQQVDSGIHGIATGANWRVPRSLILSVK